MGTTADQQKLMFAVGLSDSLNSSSEEDIIPMQKRKKRGFTRKNRNLRAEKSSFFATNYSYGLCTLIKFIFVLTVLISVIIGMVVMYSLSKRMDSLFLSISGLQSTNKELPEDLHSLHSKFKALEQESTNLKINLNNVIITTSNLTQQTAQIRQAMTSLSETVQNSPTVRLSQDVAELRKAVTELGLKIGTNDNESKLSQEQHANLELRLTSFETKLQLIQQNLSAGLANQTVWNQKMEQIINVINQRLDGMNATVVSLMQQKRTAVEAPISHQQLSVPVESPNVASAAPAAAVAATQTLPPATPPAETSGHGQPESEHSGHIIKKVLNVENITASVV